MSTFECVSCSSIHESDALEARCPRCGSAVLLVGQGPSNPSESEIDKLPPGVWRFRMLLPEVSEGKIVTLGEGGTPLLPAKRLGTELGLQNLMIKDETMNPTGSFIDRGSTVLVSLARERGVRKFNCVTTGNLGASLAAYSAKAGIETEIRIKPSVDRGKLYQMIMYGAKVQLVSGTRAGGAQEVLVGGAESGSQAVSAANPFILEGEKTTGFEIQRDLDWVQPDVIVLPVGTGGHMTMMWRSLVQMNRAGLIGEPSCRLIGVHLPSSSSTADEEEKSTGRVPMEALTELEASEPIFRTAAKRAIKESGGHEVEVSTKEVIQGMSLLAKNEGIFTEPAGASVVASLRLARDRGFLKASDRIVCVVTGAGLKDTKAISRIAKMPPRLVPTGDFMIRPLDVGKTKLRVMKILADGPTFGYVLWKSLSKERHITTASVYQHLSELETAALVRRSRVVRFGGRERVFYELTPRGSELLRALSRAA